MPPTLPRTGARAARFPHYAHAPEHTYAAAHPTHNLLVFMDNGVCKQPRGEYVLSSGVLSSCGACREQRCACANVDDTTARHTPRRPLLCGLLRRYPLRTLRYVAHQPFSCHCCARQTSPPIPMHLPAPAWPYLSPLPCHTRAHTCYRSGLRAAQTPAWLCHLSLWWVSTLHAPPILTTRATRLALSSPAPHRLIYTARQHQATNSGVKARGAATYR